MCMVCTCVQAGRRCWTPSSSCLALFLNLELTVFGQAESEQVPVGLLCLCLLLGLQTCGTCNIWVLGSELQSLTFQPLTL